MFLVHLALSMCTSTLNKIAVRPGEFVAPLFGTHTQRKTLALERTHVQRWLTITLSCNAFPRTLSNVSLVTRVRSPAHAPSLFIA